MTDQCCKLDTNNHYKIYETYCGEFVIVDNNDIVSESSEKCVFYKEPSPKGKYNIERCDQKEIKDKSKNKKYNLDNYIFYIAIGIPLSIMTIIYMTKRKKLKNKV